MNLCKDILSRRRKEEYSVLMVPKHYWRTY